MTKAAYLDGTRGGVGSEREVRLRTLGRFRERFIGWDEPSRYAFTAIATTSPMLARFAEDYRLTAIDGGTPLDWTTGAELRGPAKLGAPVLRVIMRRLFTRGMRNPRWRMPTRSPPRWSRPEPAR